MKVVLLVPPYNNYRVGESLGIRYLTSFLRIRGFECECLDIAQQNYTNNDVVAIVSSLKPNIIGFSVAFSKILEQSIDLINALRHALPSVHITVGGMMPSLNPTHILMKIHAVDSVVCGEGELALLALARGIHPSKIKGCFTRDSSSGFTESIKNLDDLPFPFREDLKKHDLINMATITSRGCPRKCSFCTVPAFREHSDAPKWRQHSNQYVLAELHELINNFPSIKAVSFIDDNLIGPSKGSKSRILDLIYQLDDANLPIKWSFDCRASQVDSNLFSDMVDVGLRHVALGIESASRKQLQAMRKGTLPDDNVKAIHCLQDLGITISPYAILFHPTSDWNTILETISFFSSCGLLSADVLTTRLVPYLGTKDFVFLKARGLLKPDGLFSYIWKHRNPKIDNLWEFLDRNLDPLFDVESELSTLQFSLDVADVSPSKQTENLLTLRKEYAFQLGSTVTRLISTFRRESANQEKNAFIREIINIGQWLSREISCFSSSVPMEGTILC